VTVAIRPASPGDAGAIARVRVASWRATYRGIVPDAYLDAMQEAPSAAMWERVLSAGADAATVVVATDADEVVGFAASNRLPEPKRGLDSELTAAYVLPAWQRAGIGRRLVHDAVHAQRGLGASAMIAWVIAKNRGARAFLERLSGELVVEQPFEWDGIELVEAGYAFRDLDAVVARCNDWPAAAPGTLH
jgi:GNAT superfamily N-acetyltransferase